MQWHIMLNLNKGNVLNPDITMMELAPLDIILMQSTPLLLDQCILDTLGLSQHFIESHPLNLILFAIFFLSLP